MVTTKTQQFPLLFKSSLFTLEKVDEKPTSHMNALCRTHSSAGEHGQLRFFRSLVEGEATSYGAAPEAAGKAGPENGRKIQGFRIL